MKVCGVSLTMRVLLCVATYIVAHQQPLVYQGTASAVPFLAS